MKRLITHLALALLMVGGLGMTILPTQVAHAAATRPLTVEGDTSYWGPSTTTCPDLTGTVQEWYGYTGQDLSYPKGHLFVNYLGSTLGPPNFTDYSDKGPSITCFLGHVYFAWHAADSSNAIWIGYYSFGNCPFLQPCTLANRLTIPNQSTYGTPALATSCDGGKMYAAWEGLTNNHIYIASTTNGTSWTNPTQLADTTIARPALTCFQTHLYVAWTGTDNPAHIWLGYYTDGHTTLGNHTVLPETTFDGVGLSTYNNRLQVAWVGYTNYVVFTGSWAPFNWQSNRGLPGAPVTYNDLALNGQDCYWTDPNYHINFVAIYG